MADVSKMLAGLKPFFEDHLQRYLANGTDGHILDTSPYGGRAETTTLLLKTIGRHSGRAFLTPLIYDKVGEECAIVASKGGADDHPAWFLNLTARPEVSFQIAEERFQGTWRIAGGEERRKVWNQMVAYYPPYDEYQTITERLIPIVLLKPQLSIDKL